MTTVACVYVRGHVPFSSDYVNRLASMVKRWMDRPFRFVCFTDKVRQSIHPHIEQIPIDWSAVIYGWWAKLHIWRRDVGLTGRVLYLDLDTLVVDSLAPLLDYPAPLALIPHTGRFDGLHGRQVVKRFNSSVMVFNAGEQAHLYEAFTPDVAARLHGDQDWIGEREPLAATMPLEWFPRISELKDQPPSAYAKVVLMKTPKNAEAIRKYRWVREQWR